MAQDRAARVAQAVIMVFGSAMKRWFAGEPAGLLQARAEIEDVLRTEFDDIARMTRDETRL
jgi:hypothetical protein